MTKFESLCNYSITKSYILNIKIRPLVIEYALTIKLVDRTSSAHSFNQYAYFGHSWSYFDIQNLRLVILYLFPVTVWWILHHPMEYIKYICTCTIYTRLDTCLMSISGFSLRDKVTLRLLKLYLYIADVVEWSRALNIRLSDWCCSVSMVWVQIPSREEQKIVSWKI
jgi:hypothetical protein